MNWKFHIVFLLVAVLAPSLVQCRCSYRGKTYNINSHWVQGNTICKCISTSRVYCYPTSRLARCNAWGDPHFTSFDLRKFDFQGVCRYVLAHDCCGKKFLIEVEHLPWSSATSVTDKITIRFGSKVVHLEKVQILIVNGVMKPFLFHDDSELRCEMISGYMTVTLKNLNVWLRWNFQYRVDVFVYYTYRTRMCGLCGDYNGNPSNDLQLTPTGEPVSTIHQWGESWRTNQNQPSRCKTCKPISPPAVDNCRENIHMINAQCRHVLFSNGYFSSCRRYINPGSFMKDCVTEMCACPARGKIGCICSAVSAYEKACEARGLFISDNWKIPYRCRVCRSGANVYEHGDTWREGCYEYKCYNGARIRVRTSRVCCTDPNTRRVYMSGSRWNYRCYIRSCINGRLISSIKRYYCCLLNRRYYLPGYFRIGTCSYRCTRGQLSKPCIQSV